MGGGAPGNLVERPALGGGFFRHLLDSPLRVCSPSCSGPRHGTTAAPRSSRPLRTPIRSGTPVRRNGASRMSLGTGDDRLFFGDARCSTEEQVDNRNGLQAQRGYRRPRGSPRFVEQYADESASGKYINSKPTRSAAWLPARATASSSPSSTALQGQLVMVWRVIRSRPSNRRRIVDSQHDQTSRGGLAMTFGGGGHHQEGMGELGR